MAVFGIDILIANMHIHPKVGRIFGSPNWRRTLNEIKMRKNPSKMMDGEWQSFGNAKRKIVSFYALKYKKSSD